ncbi:MAG: hypothetical protein ILO34_06630 [Kiritimatiellae bacterium]|nr:hypothetical protein [Kiritimatiellia bacterium]
MKPANREYAFVGSLGGLYRLLRGCWRRETCAPRLQKKWSESDPTCGQCSITAFLAQDIFGGGVYGVPNSDGGFHCFNVVGGAVFDLTSEQFDHPLEYTMDFPQSREMHFAKAEKKSRYETLVASLVGKAKPQADATALRALLAAIAAAAVWAAACPGVTIHRSFRTREVGIGGGAGVIVPVERKVAEALDRQAQEEAERRLKIVGRVTGVENFNTVYVTPNGGQRRCVRLEAVSAADDADAAAKQRMLRDLAYRKTVEIHYRSHDQYGNIVGIMLVKNGKKKGLLNINATIMEAGR